MIEKLKETYTETTRGKIAQKINEIIAALNPILEERESEIKVYEETMEMVKQNSQPKTRPQDRMIGCTTLDIPTTYNVATGETKAPEENIYTKTCRMDKELAEAETKRVQEKLRIAVEALTTIRKYTAINQFKPKTREAYLVAKKALEQINNKE